MPSTATTRTVTGLTNDTAYAFRVAAVNGIGTGAYSTASSAVTPVAGDALFASVQLLLPGDTTVNDASAYSRSVTASGAAVSTAQKKYGAGSIAISGSGQYLAVTSNAAMNMSGDFVIEFWVRLANATAQGWFMGGPENANGYLMGGFNLTGSGQIWLGGANTTWPLQFGGASLANDTWHHIAIARSGSSNRLYVDGSQVGSAITDSTSWVVNPTAVWIGSQQAGSSMNGFIDDFRLTVGSARGMTGATITVPTAAFATRGVYEDPFFESVSLILPMDGTGSTFTDSSLTPKTITANGNATQSAAQSKWGGKSMYISSASDYLSFASSADLSFGTGDFVIEGWVYLSSVTAYQFLIGQNQDSGGYMMVAFNYDGNSGTIAMGRSSIGWPVVFSGHGMSANTWHYIAISRTGSTNRCYVNGSKIGSDVTDSTDWQSNLMRIGNHIGVQPINGYIDDLRLTKGSARGMTGATTPVPTAAFPTS
jgi:hypothetical protein